MNREEAITILKDLWCYEHTKYNDNEVRIALDIAIKALEQEPCGDSISRQQTKEMIKKLAEYHTGDHFNADRIIRNVNELPSVKQELNIDILDKIKSELKSKRAYFLLSHHDYAVAYGLEIALDIINEVIKEVNT